MRRGLFGRSGMGAAVLAAAMVLSQSCSSPTGDATAVARVMVQPPNPTLGVGSALPLQATVQDADGHPLAGRSIFWSSENPAVASVSSTGVVTGKMVGTVQIAASVEGTSGLAAVTVTALPVASVSVLPDSAELQVGATAQLRAVTYDASGHELQGRPVLWSSRTPGVASVTDAGLVTALRAGSSTITATSEGKTGTAIILVARPAVAQVTLSPSSPSVTAGQTVQLTATIIDAAGDTVTALTPAWSSSNADVASVTSTGLVTARRAGSATIIASAGGASGQTVVTVTPAPVASVVISPPGLRLELGATGQLSAEVRDAAGTVLTDRSVAWSSDNEQVATVSATGAVTARRVGTATITATSEGTSDAVQVIVVPKPVAGVDVNPSTLSLPVGHDSQLTATPRDAEGNALDDREVVWSSDAEGVATVSATGQVAAVGPGTAIISATSEGKVGRATVTVTEVRAARVEVTPSFFVLRRDDDLQLTATVFDREGNELHGRQVTWSSSANSKANVSENGMVHAKKTGTVSIRATVDGVSDAATIIITDR